MENNTRIEIPIVFATNNKYAKYADVCIESIMDKEDKKSFYRFFVLHTELDDEVISKLNRAEESYSVECINVSDIIENVAPKMYSHSYFSKEMYYRILIPRLFPQYSRVIYLDCDMIVVGDIRKLYRKQIGECVLAACVNPMHNKMSQYVAGLGLNPAKYFNSGMLLINTKQFIKENIEEKFFNELKKHDNLLYPDQDLLNIVCEGKVKFIEPVWNYMWHFSRMQNSNNKDLHLPFEIYNDYIKNSATANIVHFTGDTKPWNANGLAFANDFWSFAKKSAFYKSIWDEFLTINENINKLKFEYVDFSKGKIILTCSFTVVDPMNKDSILISVNGDLIKPTVYFKRNSTTSNVKVIIRYFKIEVPISSIKNNNSIQITIARKYRSVLFEYGKFFPLNGCKTSYYIHNGIMLYRKGKMLVLSRTGLREKASHEIEYDKELITKCGKKQGLKIIFARMFYFFVAPFVKKPILLFNDRPDVAGDNAEALFNYYQTTHKGYSTYFVIRRSSKDYARLKKVGKVVAAESLKHKLLKLLSSCAICSQTDFETFCAFNQNYVKDIMLKEKRVFLQHGITKDDVSALYSKYNHNFSLFITAAIPEYQSIINNKNYGCDSSITKLTGFARHDLLHSNKNNEIIICPTWRKDLVKDFLSGEVVDDFCDSAYFIKYHELLANPALTAILNKYDYTLKFIQHNMLKHSSKYFDDVNSERIKVVNQDDISYSRLFSDAALMITDYSSNAFEFAYLRKPILYYQFDRDMFFKSHTYSKGYFEYESDGFGDVINDENTLIKHIDAILSLNCELSERYAERINSFFKFNDNKNRERIALEIDKKLR